jgi:hypothetical protein
VIPGKFPGIVAFPARRHYQREGIYLMEKLRILILFVIATPFGASAMIGCGREVSRVSELMLRCIRVMNEQFDYRVVQFLGP